MRLRLGESVLRSIVRFSLDHVRRRLDSGQGSLVTPYPAGRPFHVLGSWSARGRGVVDCMLRWSHLTLQAQAARCLHRVAFDSTCQAHHETVEKTDRRTTATEDDTRSQQRVPQPNEAKLKQPSIRKRLVPLQMPLMDGALPTPCASLAGRERHVPMTSVACPACSRSGIGHRLGPPTAFVCHTLATLSDSQLDSSVTDHFAHASTIAMAARELGLPAAHDPTAGTC